ncbi:indole-3-glycerol phosphate synthase TrpC [Aquibacillus koreensis]|uniref:Indole-3-glycerol phosphate synthase n=1 Tax=Aquibacillus koreensis TaxID=279446 RepID=A0A9X3WL64_9BACI|nr:indole-3-glycerol phosphate synthase TrpC [Aquibacillus koreensis]MCT2538188.1 indole-3-glycerol phosphate synthase TrpC [Aquibacillus koreensis]MDC3420868.1 indole-3-glycerol phosphate synthase TrpC [Aquibacillus koreensis]
MTTILDKILIEKEKEVAVLKESYQPSRDGEQVKRPSLYDVFMQSDRMNIIAEIKRASPSKGIINADVNPPEQAKQYESYGAGLISVLTDEPFFKGTMADLQAVHAAVQVPLLNKDFIIDEIQIDRAKDYGASVILLIAAALPKERLQALYTYATERGLDVLFEVHDEEEMQVAKDIGANIIGINNRNLKTFEVDLAITERLAKLVDTDKTLVISESGFQTTDDVERIKKSGIRGILVGETMMRSKNLEQTFGELRVSL